MFDEPLPKSRFRNRKSFETDITSLIPHFRPAVTTAAVHSPELVHTIGRDLLKPLSDGADMSERK